MDAEAGGLRYGYSVPVDNTVENSSVFSLNRMRWLPSARAYGQSNFAPTNPPVLNWRCQLTQADLYNGRKTVVVILLYRARGPQSVNRALYCCGTVHSIPTSGPVSTWMGDRLWAGIPSRYVTSQLGQLSLASFRGRLIEYQLRLR